MYKITLLGRRINHTSDKDLRQKLQALHFRVHGYYHKEKLVHGK